MSTQARLLRADIRVFQWDWPAAQREFRRALAAAPNNADALGAYAMLLSSLGYFSEARPMIQRALAMDPLNASRHIGAGTVARFMGRFDEAEEHDRAALRIAPNSALAYWALWQIYNEKQQFTAAFAALKGYFLATADTGVLTILEGEGSASDYHAALHRVADALVERSRSRYVKPYWPAALYAYAGDTSRALDWLERSVEGREPEMRNLGTWQLAKAFRHQPRYQALLRRTKLDVGLGALKPSP